MSLPQVPLMVMSGISSRNDYTSGGFWRFTVLGDNLQARTTLQAGGAMGRQSVSRLLVLWVLVSFSSFVQLVQAQNSTYSTNPADYNFGWLAAGIFTPGSEPYCTFCVNALTYDYIYTQTSADKAHGTYWNLTVGTYRCDGVEPNEFWAYDAPTQAIVFGNLTQGNLTELLCIDSVPNEALGVLKLRTCNSSLLSQKWSQKDDGRIVSEVPGPGGEDLFMVGYIPDPQTSPTNTIYEFNVTLHSSLPSPIPGYSYAYNFSFLSKKTFVDPSTNRFTTQALLDLTNNTVDAIVNGGFEKSVIQAGSDIAWSDYTQPTPSYFALCGWVIDYGPIDYVKAGLLTPAQGSWSIHLNTHTDINHEGQVSQTIKTEVGREYLLSFFLNGFPPGLQITGRAGWQCSSTYTEAQMQVGISNSTSTVNNAGPSLQTDGYGLQQNFSIGVTPANVQTFGSLWKQNFITFRAIANVTTIYFKSLTFNNSCGPMIDEVTLALVRPKSFWAKTPFKVIIGCVAGLLLVGILVGVYFGRRRFCGSDEDYSNLYTTENARVFSIKELSTSTKKFSAVLGEGGFGTVYKADFPDGTAGAVKVEKSRDINWRSSKVLAADEIAVLLRVHHRNLVNLIGFCIHRRRHMLVFEYLPNGSLYDRLHQSVLPISPGSITKSTEPRQLYENILPWHKRTKIACDVAFGLEYLHHDADPPIVHRDVKSRNILLTATDSAKLADFGLSKAAPVDATSFESKETLVRGSIGYLDPNYFLTGVFSAKSDVYSYGVVLLELISGHQAIYNTARLGAWAAPFLTSPSLYHELADKNLDGKYEFDELESLVELCKICIQEDSRMRPTMRQVVAFLNNRHLVAAGSGESAESISPDDTISREAYHKMHPLFIDFEAVPTDSPGNSDGVFVPPSPRN